MRRLLAVAMCAGLITGLVMVGGASAVPAEEVLDFKVPVRAQLNFSASECSNTSSVIHIDGSLTYDDGLQVKVKFSNNVKGTRTVTDVGDATLAINPDSGELTIPKQPAFGGVGGNPHISFDFADDSEGPIYLGRCVQGFSKKIDTWLGLAAQAIGSVRATECSNKGTSVLLGGMNNIFSAEGTLQMDNNKNKVVHQDQAESTFSVGLGGGLGYKKGGGTNQAGGNPHIYLQFLQDDGITALTDYKYLGRCKQLL